MSFERGERVCQAGAVPRPDRHGTVVEPGTYRSQVQWDDKHDTYLVNNDNLAHVAS